MGGKKRSGREFEEAVYAFVKTLDPSAEVIFDHRIPDRDSGRLRQCDVWINANFGGHWSLSILVSCKDRGKSGRKLGSGDIGTFCDEVRSTGASMGVIYCNTGFSAPAIRKAKANGIACCRLYQNEPADIPEAIWLDHFLCKPTVQLGLSAQAEGWQQWTWDEVFDTSVRLDEDTITVLDLVAKVYADAEAEAMQRVDLQKPIPVDWRRGFVMEGTETPSEIRLTVVGGWKWYGARSEAILLDGSYCLSDGSFRGSLYGPAIDTRGDHPGEAWVEIDAPDVTSTSNMCVAVLQADVKAVLREKFGPKAVGAPY